MSKSLDKKIIETIKKRLVQEYSPLAIYLFGSYAWGKPNENSDLDFLIIVENIKMLDRPFAFKAHKVLSDINISKDIIVIGIDEFLNYSDNISTLYYKIRNEAIKIYGTI